MGHTIETEVISFDVVKEHLMDKMRQRFVRLPPNRCTLGG